MNINQITISGRLGSDAEVMKAGSKSVVKLNLASTQSRKDQSGEWVDDTTWFTCELWSRESVAPLLKKGMHVVVQGRMKCDKYDKDGQTRYAWKVVVSQVDFVSQMKSEATGGSSSKAKNDLPF